MTPRIIAQTLALLLCCAGLSSAAEGNAPRQIRLEECRQFVTNREGVVLDARATKYYDKAHLPGAISLPVRDFAAAYPKVEAKLAKDKNLLIYCTSVSCPDSDKLGRKLAELGYTKVMIFKGGLAEWWKAGLPVEKATP